MLFQPAIMRRWQSHGPVENKTVMLHGDQQPKQLITNCLPPPQGKAMVQRGWWEEKAPTPQTSMVRQGEAVLGGRQGVVVLKAGAAAVRTCIFVSF